MKTLKVLVTKEHLKQSMYCGFGKNDKEVGKNCAIALAVREIFPDAWICSGSYAPFYSKNNEICANHNASEFISEFDESAPLERLTLPETEVELELTDEILDELNKNVNWEEIVNNTKHLKLIS